MNIATPAYKRILLKLSGEALMGDDAFGINRSTIVRMVLVPATMALMGDANWWLPKWLGRILPEIDLDHPVSEEDVTCTSRGA